MLIRVFITVCGGNCDTCAMPRIFVFARASALCRARVDHHLASYSADPIWRPERLCHSQLMLWSAPVFADPWPQAGIVQTLIGNNRLCKSDIAFDSFAKSTLISEVSEPDCSSSLFDLSFTSSGLPGVLAT